MSKQKIILSSSHEHGWASEYPREFQEYFLMNAELIDLVESRDWSKLVDVVTQYWSRATLRNPKYQTWPVCTDAIPDLKIHEVPYGSRFILNEVPYENIVLINEHNVIWAM